MARFERSIQIAFDKLSGEVLDADEVFDKKKDAFEIRRQFHEKKLLLSCCECEQDLGISGSKYDRLHFKHKPHHDFCILADGELSPGDHAGLTAILKAKESARHRELKNKIGQLLSKVEGVDVSSIAIDNKLIIRGDEKRRPDVYCKYQGKELVFEIQLSNLSLGYILSRYEFYKKHGIFLIWILDNFDIHNQGALERDIKYLTKYENFFKLDEDTDSFSLECEYKFPFLTEENKLLTKWLKKYVSLNKLKFDTEIYQIFYYNFGDNKAKKEVEQKKKTEELKEAERKRIAEQRLAEAKDKSDFIIQEIKIFRKNGVQVFNPIINQINELDEYELQVLNSTLGFSTRDKSKIPPLHSWIQKALHSDITFIEFILNCEEIEIDVNVRDVNGKTSFQQIYENHNICKHTLVNALFERGYRLTEEDRIFFSQLQGLDKDDKHDIILYGLYNSLSDKHLVNTAFYHRKLLYIIESARKNEIIGFNYKPNEWIAFANNAIEYHSEYWEYIEVAFKNYGIWQRLKENDKKGTFHKKLMKFYATLPTQKFDFDELFRDLYPELSYARD